VLWRRAGWAAAWRRTMDCHDRSLPLLCVSDCSVAASQCSNSRRSSGFMVSTSGPISGVVDRALSLSSKESDSIDEEGELTVDWRWPVEGGEGEEYTEESEVNEPLGFREREREECLRARVSDRRRACLAEREDGRCDLQSSHLGRAMDYISGAVNELSCTFNQQGDSDEHTSI
jgi:hypothetical protein